MYKVDLKMKCISPLLTTNPEDADGLALRVDNSFKEIESHMEDFNSVHREYVKKVTEKTRGDENEVFWRSDRRIVAAFTHGTGEPRPIR